MSSPAAQLRSRMPRIAPYIGGAAVEKARLRVVPRRAPRRTKVPFVALVSLVLLSGVVGLLLFNTSMQQAAFATTALEHQATTLAARQQTLEMEIDELRNPQHLAQEAVSLGMVPGGNPAFLDLETGKVLGVPSPATPETAIRLQAKLPVKPEVLDPTPIVHQVVGDGPSSAELVGRGGRDGGRPVTDGNGDRAGRN